MRISEISDFWRDGEERVSRGELSRKTHLTQPIVSTTTNNLRVGLNKGYPTTQLPKRVKPSHRKGANSERGRLVKGVIREVAGFAPYEKRVMELLRNSKDKKARKLTKKRLGTLRRAKGKVEELSSVIQEARWVGFQFKWLNMYFLHMHHLF
ncbi:hypothetical protein E3P92_03462 [Wallemia ichthyophaga]|uniref:60S ribosomal protein L36 n=1 Tax=Wallemia ichthyophaga TaxID=245174 RepID=A0A4T0I569_WALIC|nr:hypothetical protein E3P98_00159 [Wallemia ichthyophaga]TIB05171.1 hypothetical protein E3P96_01343 [Wallemia ichthyophaga]TIB08113.1 hypothetical protein E3P93_03608 [Wallemia ichthyophaga]TIB09470.1 hypothetical protein E3P92_03462 [Wallemia ichthyophaga]TIB11959.1 hypothetical protein E3P90_02265 [Wallemia ichthyophaga]